MKHLGTQTIETNRLILKKFEIKDAQKMFNNWASSDEVTKYLTWKPHKDVSVSKEWIEFLISNKGYIAGGTMGVYKSIIYKSSSISEKQKKILAYYYEEGYNLIDEALVEQGREI